MPKKEIELVYHKGGLCFRCNSRAIFLETGYGPRYECKNAKTSVHGCYAYKPVKPLYLIKSDTTDIRPHSTGYISSRSYPKKIAESVLNGKKPKKNELILYWVPT